MGILGFGKKKEEPSIPLTEKMKIYLGTRVGKEIPADVNVVDFHYRQRKNPNFMSFNTYDIYADATAKDALATLDEDRSGNLRLARTGYRR